MSVLNLYTSAGKRYDFSSTEEIGRGKYGVVYRNGDKAVKLLNKPDNERMSKVISAIRRLKLKNYYKIYDLLFFRKFITRSFAGVVSKYYPSEVEDVLEMPMDYLLDNFASLCESQEILADNNILVNDLYSDNVILGSDEITVIDVDLYSKISSVDSKSLRACNIYALKQLLFQGLLAEHCCKFHGDDIDFDISKFNKKIRELIVSDSGYVGEKEPVFKTLSKYRKPIDYVKKILK